MADAASLPPSSFPVVRNSRNAPSSPAAAHECGVRSDAPAMTVSSTVSGASRKEMASRSSRATVPGRFASTIPARSVVATGGTARCAAVPAVTRMTPSSSAVRRAASCVSVASSHADNPPTVPVANTASTFSMGPSPFTGEKAATRTPAASTASTVPALATRETSESSGSGSSSPRSAARYAWPLEMAATQPSSAEAASASSVPHTPHAVRAK